MADGVGPLFFRNLYNPFCYNGTREGGSQQVILVCGSRLHRGNNIFIHKFFLQIFYVKFGSACLKRLLLKSDKLRALAHIGGYGHHLAAVILF